MMDKLVLTTNQTTKHKSLQVRTRRSGRIKYLLTQTLFDNSKNESVSTSVSEPALQKSARSNNYRI
jgi:hypothetical protein